jgi:C1A family cysteine protease
MPTYGEIRRALSESEARWQTDPGPADDQQVFEHALGVPSDEQLVRAAEVAPIDLAAIVAEHPTANPFLDARRAVLGLPARSTEHAPAVLAAAADQIGTEEAGFAAAVDWRNRFGTNWVTGVRDQDPCGSCVSFGTTCVIESRVRIEHAVWTIRSEGDAHDGLGLHCADGSWPDTYFDWIKAHGICDPQCWPYRTDNPVYQPTPDRTGRTVKIDGYTQLGSLDDQKKWLDTVGPITCCLEVWTDFDAYSTGVFHHTTGTFRGLHCIAIIGYSETDRCWIAKNSWGPAWGDRGYIRIGYGEIKIDEFAKYGVVATNPDPWTKRRLHNGNLYESGNGAGHHNFEMLAPADGGQVRHWWRESTWQPASEFASTPPPARR